MRLLLQQGHNMMPLVRDFLRSHQTSGVILSPRAYRNPSALPRDAEEIRQLGGVVLLDPQFYLPRTDHPNIVQHEYWAGLDFATTDFDPANFCERVVEYQVQRVGVDEIILPGRYTDTADEPWRELQMSTAVCGSQYATGTPIYMTVALGSAALTSISTFDAVLDQVVNYPVDGIYFLAQHPRNHFLIEDDALLYALLDGFLSICRAGKRVLYGYGNQQSLVFAAAGVTDLASGNFRNTRQFNSEMFAVREPGGQQRATWYYDANTLGEYRIEQLSLAFRRGMRGRFGPVCDKCRLLLEAQEPTNVPWDERDAFHHFLHELRRQWMDLGTSGPRARERASAVCRLVESAVARTQALRDDGFSPGERGFAGAAADASIAALTAFSSDRASDLTRLAI